ncbi:hypothetical protein [Alkaliphilus oremlandii]|uniref:hypothetical protein n=1 Tax=Alkaliphilus oremlandii TaxID=461876 RepID=UPI0002FFADBD|nr:hypothetical protein [Alkaliphilus oremlandii]
MIEFRIRSTSIEILEFLILRAIETGSFKISFTNEEILQKINNLDLEKLSLCLSYLYDSELLNFERKGPNDSRFVKITSKAVDMIES